MEDILEQKIKNEICKVLNEQIVNLGLQSLSKTSIDGFDLMKNLLEIRSTIIDLVWVLIKQLEKEDKYEKTISKVKREQFKE